YAGLTHGRVCLCGNALTSASASQPTCNQACLGNPAQSCGSDTVHMDVHQLLSAPLSNFNIDVPLLIETYKSTNMLFNVTGGNGVTISGTISDGSGDFSLPVSIDTLDHSLQKPGTIVIKASASDSLNGQTRIKGVIIDCPDIVLSTERFTCHVTITMGTNINIQVDAGDGTLIPLNV
ncbi:hypothetical protein MAR_029786, partial [Mya arenaria]